MGQTTTTKITYATLSGEGLDEVHAALDAAIERAPESFGDEYGMIIGEDLVAAAQQFEDNGIHVVEYRDLRFLRPSQEDNFPFTFRVFLDGEGRVLQSSLLSP